MTALHANVDKAQSAKYPSDDFRLHSVLAATDFSAASEKAVRHAVAIARYFGAKPYAIHVARSYRDVTVSDLQYGNVLERELETCNGQFAFREGDVSVLVDCL